MNRTATLVWRIAVVLMLVTTIPVGIYAYEAHREVDTEAMLDVSVSIRTVSHVSVDKFGDSVWSRASGSGFLVDKGSCEIWTNHHVVEAAAIIEVFPRGWEGNHGIPAKVVATTPRHDVAVLRIEHCADVEAARLGKSRSVATGDDTYAVGNPLGHNPDSLSRGIVSHVERYVQGPTPYLQTDAAINLGNSGGALFDRDGRVIGMNTAIAATRGGGNVGIGYATPIELVQEVAMALRRGDFAWGEAGLEGLLSVLSVDEARVFGVPTGAGAVNVIRTPTEGPATGKLMARDVIYRIGDAVIDDPAVALRHISEYRPGEIASMHVIRDGQHRVIAVELADGSKPSAAPEPQPYDGHLGMGLEMWSTESGQSQTFGAPVITAIHSLGPAHRSLISSSQRGAAMRGPFMVTFQMDVKTVSGVVYRGSYRPIDRIETLNHYAAQAAMAGDPLLLEVELWRRDDPSVYQGPLERQGTAFYKVDPSTSLIHPASPADDYLAQGGI